MDTQMRSKPISKYREMRCLDIEVKVKTKTLNRLIGLWCWREWCIDVNLKIKIEVCRLRERRSCIE